METIYTTSAYAGQLFTRTFSKEAFLDDAQRSGARALRVQTRFFPERAMYWTRMFRDAAAKRGMDLAAIELSSELLGGEEAVNAQRANLSEWIRIAALSRIGRVMVRVDGAGDSADARRRLVSALEPLTGDIKQYGVKLVLASGSAALDDAQLLEAAKALGYDVCRVHFAGEAKGTDKLWEG